MEMILAVAWASLTTFLILILPDAWSLPEFLARLPLVMFVFVLLGYSCACLQTTFAAGRTGQAGYVAWPQRGLTQAVRSGAQAVVCYLAGPVVPAVVALWFWLNSGDFTWVDWSIVAELGILGVGYWALTLMAVQERGRFRDANPAAVVRLVARLGWRVLLAALLLAVVVIGHGLLAIAAVEELHRGPRGWMLLVGCFAGQFFWMVLLLRWLGVSSYRASKRRGDHQDAKPAPTSQSHSRRGLTSKQLPATIKGRAEQPNPGMEPNVQEGAEAPFAH
jgi:hypothetical protein